MPRIAIIGAGACGLPCIRHALLYDVEPVVFDLSDEVGGLWNFKANNTSESSVARNTIANTSKEAMAYSDFPPPAHFANFMHNTQLLEYYKLYAEHHGLAKYIRFRHKVHGVKRAESYAKDGKWLLTYENLKTGEIKEEEFDAVMLASGHHVKPFVPAWKGLNKFKGKLLHSQVYKDNRGFEDKTVVVVGIGNSACDIALKMVLWVHLSTRRGAWIYTRIQPGGQPYDLDLNSRYNDTLRNWFFSRCNKAIEESFQKRFDHEAYGLKPNHGVFNCSPTVNDDIPYRVMCGRLKIQADVKEFKENDVVFVDGTKIENVDCVVSATGYNLDFEILEQGKLVAAEGLELYLYMYPPELSNHNSLAFIGLVQTSGPIQLAAEMQARLFLEAFAAKKLTLPSKEEMYQSIKEHKAMQAGNVQSMRHILEIEYCGHMEELAGIIGCKPNFLQLAFSDPELAWKIFFGPRVSYSYRLNGAHVWKDARKAIMSVDERVQSGLNPKNPKLRGSCCLAFDAETVIIMLAVAVFTAILFKMFF
ncbi:hypothetical protein L596_012045 [Steinernema carpocapsae]|uniref:Flavin-containing monooxygenase n=1 Tax=Steinernema carpocapsae TaxID=34508 RepID=A0A4U5NWR8_STECR|nr:hypothetical protein L596_012045 [Steinernema carpocapsae]